MSSPPNRTMRRVPQQERGERRRAEILEAAAQLIGELGYEAATMTAVAERAHTAIGTVYEYFPNKEAVAKALHSHYGIEIEDRWVQLDKNATGLSVKEMVDEMIDVIVSFMNERPAYIPLLSAPIFFKRDPAARIRLRERFAGFFIAKKPSLSREAAFRVASILLQTVKGLYALYADAKPRERTELVTEYKQLLTAYLEARLSS